MEPRDRVLPYELKLIRARRGRFRLWHVAALIAGPALVVAVAWLSRFEVSKKGWRFSLPANSRGERFTVEWVSLYGRLDVFTEAK